jgi:hypothetical protein
MGKRPRPPPPSFVDGKVSTSGSSLILDVCASANLWALVSFSHTTVRLKKDGKIKTKKTNSHVASYSTPTFPASTSDPSPYNDIADDALPELWEPMADIDERIPGSKKKAKKQKRAKKLSTNMAVCLCPSSELYLC